MCAGAAREGYEPELVGEKVADEFITIEGWTTEISSA